MTAWTRAQQSKYRKQRDEIFFGAQTKIYGLNVGFKAEKENKTMDVFDLSKQEVDGAIY